jgi:hypothetical protein
MKRIAKLMACVLVVAAISACGASPRSGRKAVDQAKADALGPIFDAQNTDFYRYTWGSMESTVSATTGVSGALYMSGVNFDVLGLAYDNQPITTLSFLEVGIAVDKTSKKCGMYVGTELYQYGDESKPAFVTIDPSRTSILANSVTCTVNDGFSDLTILITPLGTTAKVTIMDIAAGPFMTMQNFVIGQ